MTQHSNERVRRAVRHAFLLSAAAALAACSGGGDNGTAPVTPPKPNFIHLQSDAGDYIGGGSTYDYTQATAVISVSATTGHLALTVSGDQSWFADMATPAGVPLQPGTYANVTRYPSIRRRPVV